MSAPPNRITRALDDIRAKCDALPPENLAKLDSEMAVSFTEHYAFQNAQARAHALGKITTEEAQLIYQALGESCSGSNGGWKAGVTTAEKVTITLAVSDLLKGRQ